MIYMEIIGAGNWSKRKKKEGMLIEGIEQKIKRRKGRKLQRKKKRKQEVEEIRE